MHLNPHNYSNGSSLRRFSGRNMNSVMETTPYTYTHIHITWVWAVKLDTFLLLLSAFTDQWPSVHYKLKTTAHQVAFAPCYSIWDIDATTCCPLHARQAGLSEFEYTKY